MRKKRVSYRVGEFHQGCLGNPEQLLQVRWRTLIFEKLRIYLQCLLIAENRCFPTNFQGKRVSSKRWLASRLRSRRLVVLKHFLELGGNASLRASAWSLPRGRHWPGAIHLVGAYTDEDNIQKNV